MSIRDDDMREVYVATSDAMVQILQLVVTLAAIIAEDRARQREELYRRELETEASRARAEAERLRAERAAAEPLLRAAHQERFWADLERHPERLGRTWQAAAEWAGGDPYAAHTLQHLKDQLKERYGLTVPDWPVGGADLARLITLVDPAFRKRLDAAREAAVSAPDTSYAVIIRDANDAGRILYRGEAAAEAGLNAETFAARQMEAWRASADAEAHRGRAPGDFVVEVIENTGTPDAGHVPAAVLNGSDTTAVLEADSQRLRDVANGTVQPETHAEHLRALKVALEEMEAEEARRVQRYEEYSAKLLANPDLPRADRKRLEGNLEHIQGGLDVLRQQQAAAALQMAATAAEMHGENPRHVYDAARLTESLDKGWWQTANAGEIAGIWEHVAQWDPGAARTETQAVIRDEIERRFHMGIPKEATPEAVAAIIGGLHETGQPSPLNQTGEMLRAKAQALFDAANDDLSAARDLVTRPESEHTPAERQRAEHLRQEADAHVRRGFRLIEQATWVEAQAPETLARVYAENSGAAVAELREEFERRWGQELPETAAAAVEQLAAAPADRTVWTVLASEGSSDLTAVPAFALAIPSQGTPEPAENVVSDASAAAADQEAERVRLEQGRREQAMAEYREMEREDAEAAEAVRLADLSYPEGPEAAVAHPPATGSSRGTPSPARGPQHEATLER